MMLRVLLCSLVLSSPAFADPFRWQGEDPIALRADAGRKKATGIALMVFGSLNLTLAIGMGIGGSLTCGEGCELWGPTWVSVTGTAAGVAGLLLGVGIPLYGAGVRRGARADRIEAAARRALPAGYPAPWEQREDTHAVEARGRNHRQVSRGLLIGGGVTLGLGLLGIAGWVACDYSAAGSCNGGLYIPSMLSALFGTSTGVVLTTIGGHFRRRSQVELRLALGSSVGLNGTF